MIGDLEFMPYTLTRLRGTVSLTKASKISGVDVRHLKDLESGINRKTQEPIFPSEKTLEKLAKAYNTTIKAIYTDCKSEQERVKNPTRYDRKMIWLYDLPENEKVKLCPFCEKIIDPEEVVVDSKLMKLQEKKPLVRKQILSKGMITQGSDVLFANSYLFKVEDSEVRLGRRSCGKCNTVEKHSKRMATFLSIPEKLHPSKIRRAEKIKETRSGNTNRIHIYHMENGICHICNEFVDIKEFHLEHVIPLSGEGIHSEENLKIAHPSCNYRKWAHNN
ncbi:HNH endonuclease [Paenibacillus sp. LPE1-1-1.1]|uniref:HNH endonuclease n=1 Tax=Paenibacillus sp. LPE1-1-1.1 TaxID=3135230 RepID=UPI003421E668